MSKSKNNLRKQKDFVLERTYFNKLMDARAKLPKISANYNFDTKVDGGTFSNKMEDYVIRVEKIENKYNEFLERIEDNMLALTESERLFITEVFLRGADIDIFAELHQLSEYGVRKIRQSAIIKLALEYDAEVYK